MPAVVSTSSTGGSTTYPLLPIIQRAFPNVQSYTIDQNIVQANAEGFGVKLNNDVDVFVKCVEASKYSHKPWGDLRRTLLYSRTEARFYSEILPLLKEHSYPSSHEWQIAPKCYFAESYLEGLIGEEESAAAKLIQSDDDPNYTQEDNSILQGKGGSLILQSLQDKYYQTSPLTVSQAKQCLSAIAKFHATAFGNKEILYQVSQKLCEYGGSYHLKNRNPKELANIKTTWEDFVNNIRNGDNVPKDFFERVAIRNIGQRIFDVAEYVSEELSPSYDDEYAMIVHGDYKAMNVFLPVIDDDQVDNQPLLIDFSSVGVGIGASDVAMHVTHAVEPKDLVNGGEENLIKWYLKELENALPHSKKGIYSNDIGMRHYRFATVDYFRFILGRIWRGCSLKTFEKRKNSKNFVLVSRNMEAALAFIERVDRYLDEIEREIESKNNPEL